MENDSDGTVVEGAAGTRRRSRGSRGGRRGGASANRGRPEGTGSAPAEADVAELAAPTAIAEMEDLPAPDAGAVSSEASIAGAVGPIVAEQDSAADGAAVPETEPGETAPAPARRRASRTKADSPILVNVVVPRGLGRRVNSRLIERVVRLALVRDGWSLPASVDVLMVSEEEMLEINATRRGVDEATDVLAFPLVELRPGGAVTEDFFVLPPEQEPHLGDVVISFERVESQAEAAGHSKDRELAFLTVHAVLHILGYDHDTEPARRQMRRREEEVLGELGLRRDGS